jgi:hypothetical protein
MKKFPHQQFIEDNEIAIDTLPKMLQKRIKGFEELQEDLEHTTEHDREQLLDKLDLLSMELEEDLEEEFEERLENNDYEEEEVIEDSKPEKNEVALTEPEIVEPNAIETEATEPEIIEPELVEPQAIEPVAKEHDINQPETMKEEIIDEKVNEGVSEEKIIAPEVNETSSSVEEPAVIAEVETGSVKSEIEVETRDSSTTDEEVLHDLYLKKQLKVSPIQLIQKGFQTKPNNRLIRIGKYTLYRGKYDTCYTLQLNQN